MTPRSLPAAALMRAAQDAPTRPGRPITMPNAIRVTFYAPRDAVLSWKRYAGKLSLSDYIRSRMPK